VEIATTGMSSPWINALIALLSCLIYIDFFGAERPAILAAGSKSRSPRSLG
jgi:hypothetical protein